MKNTYILGSYKVATLAVYSSLKVEPALFYMVFGESVLNDAITIVIFKVACNFIVESSVPMRCS